jgi:ubiquinone/menaquinone biosynthesis C-methylase UbiE
MNMSSLPASTLVTEASSKESAAALWPPIISNLNDLFSWPRERIASELHPDFLRYFSWHLERGNIDSYYREIRSLVAESELRGNVLDFACGFGLASVCMRAAGIDRVTGADIIVDKFETSRKLATLVGCDQVSFLKSDDHLAFEDESFDGILIKDALSHLNEDSPFLSHACRVLRPGGILLIVDDRNSLSPLNVRKTHRLWELSESGIPEESRKIGIARNFTNQRFEFLQEHFASLGRKRVMEIAREYRGYTNKQLEDWLTGGSLGAKRAPCIGPNDGVAQERLMNPFVLKRQIERLGFKCRLHHGYSDTSWKRVVLRATWPATLLYSGLFHVIARKPR